MEERIVFEILKKVLENIDEGIHFIDKNKITRIYNHNMEKIEGMSSENVIGREFKHIFEEIEESTLLNVLNSGIKIKNKKQKYRVKRGKEIVTLNSTIPIICENEVVGSLEITKGSYSISNKVKNKIKNYNFESIIGENKNIKEMIKKAKKVAKSDIAVFIYGETGTGKELLSQAIHYESMRKEAPFLAINCAALPEGVFEGILFGTTRGGFTGAIDKPGIFEQANGGTILLDEINSLSVQLQAKLLRVLQEKVVRRIGGTEDIPVDVRIISTTNENPSLMLENNKIRLDLYYRLNGIYLEIPPLRERDKDIFILTDYFIEKYNKKLDKKIKGIDEGVKKFFLEHDWLGNIRELENVIYSSMIMEEEEYILEKNLNIYLDKKNNVEELEESELDTQFNKKFLKEITLNLEKKCIIEALEMFPNNLSKAAAFLGISRQSLQYKIKKFNIYIV